MAVGAILTSEYFGGRYHVFGSILGDTFARRPSKRKIAPLEMVGLENLPVTEGITELGTAKVLAQTDPALIRGSLESLAGATDRKRFLKVLLSHVGAKAAGVSVDVPDLIETWDNTIRFSSSYTTAMTCMYLLAKGEEDLIAPLYETVPSSAKEAVGGMSLDFMLKANWDYYTFLTEDFAPSLAARLTELGFRPYSEVDWREAHAVRSYLNDVFDYPKIC